MFSRIAEFGKDASYSFPSMRTSSTVSSVSSSSLLPFVKAFHDQGPHEQVTRDKGNYKFMSVFPTTRGTL